MILFLRCVLYIILNFQVYYLIEGVRYTQKPDLPNQIFGVVLITANLLWGYKSIKILLED